MRITEVEAAEQNKITALVSYSKNHKIFQRSFKLLKIPESR